LVVPTRDLLEKIGRPYIIENVVGAPLRVDLMLCGTMFGLRIIRHRIFESNMPMPLLTPVCNHADVYDPWRGNKNADEFRKAMGVDWMRDTGGGKRKGALSQAIPPAYTKFIGSQIMVHL